MSWNRSTEVAAARGPLPNGIRHAVWAAALAATGFLSAAANAAPLSYTGGTISNDFDWLPTNTTNASQVIAGRGPHEFTSVTATSSPGRDGWQLAQPSGSSSDTEFRSQDGSLSGSAGRGVISYGTNGSTERALGTLATSNQISRYGLVLQNNSADTYVSFDISFTGEQWRRGDDGISTITFAYGTGANINAGGLIDSASLSFTSPNTQAAPLNVALNGNLPANQVAKSGTIVGLNWAPGQTLVLRWSTNEISGQDDGLGIDNFQFTANPVPEPSTLALGGLAMVGLTVAGLRRRFKRPGA